MTARLRVADTDRDPATIARLPRNELQLEPIIADRYELIRPIGEGGFSWVFLARHAQIPSLRVAIKILKADHAWDAASIRRLEREAEMAAMLRSRHTVKVVDLGVTQHGLPFLAMELVRGVPLRFLLAQRGALPALTVARLARDILEGLAEAHGRGLVHRDLKPSNVFIVQERGERPWACVIDFGIARMLDHADAARDALTVDGSVACTPEYAAPEALRGAAEPRSDLYALGLIMAEMLDGAPVCRGESSFVVASRQLSELPHELGPRARGSALAPIIARAVHKDAGQRYATAGDMMRDVEAVIARIESTGLDDRMDISLLAEDYNAGMDAQRAMTSPFSLREGVAERASIRALQGRTRSRVLDEPELLAGGAAVPRTRAVLVVAVLAAFTAAVLAGLFVLRQRSELAAAAGTALASTPSAVTAGAAAGPAVDGTTAADGAGPWGATTPLRGPIVEDLTLTRDQVWELDGLVFVERDARLTIEPGTTIVGSQGDALIVTPGASLYARGTRAAPITFTSARAVAERAPGDWGGVVLLGRAPVNEHPAHMEGIPADDARGDYGGDDPTSSCGVLEYLRIEYAGFEAWANNELNGLTLGGCGSGTIVRNVHVHATLDDGIELFGGTVDLQRIAITWPGDDALDWDQGWSGRAQFVYIHMGGYGDNGIEADSSDLDHEASPRSSPQLANVTILGTARGDGRQRAMVLRTGTAGVIRNALISGFGDDPIDVRDAATVAAIERGELRFDGLLLYGGRSPLRFDDERGQSDDDGGFVEETWLRAQSGARWGADPELIVGTASGTLVPANVALVTHDLSTPDAEFWDRGARYLGAFEPGQASTWLDGWTVVPTP